MGADIHITVGRVNRPLLEVQEPKQSEGTALAIFDNRRVRFGDIELSSDIPREVDLYRNYALFAFLANVRGSVKPIMELGRLMEATRQFVEWLNDEHYRIEGEENRKAGGWYGSIDEYIGDYGRYDVGEHSRVFYPVAILVGFNYDEVLLIEDDQSDFKDPRYLRDPENTTYRECFGEQYFKFLNWCVASNWQFVIFGFDN